MKQGALVVLLLSGFLIGCFGGKKGAGTYEKDGYVYNLNNDLTMSWSYKEASGKGRWFEQEGSLYVVHEEGLKEEFWIEEGKIINKLTTISFKKK
jgi:hypothetical protein